MSAYIDIDDDHELYVWARTFCVTPQELVWLVGEVGPSAARVREAIERLELARTRGRTPAADLKRVGG
jgi:hypothetical protein